MTWRAIWQSGSGAVWPDGSAIPPRLFRGTLLAEVDLARLDGNGDPLLQAAVPGASLSLGLKADGRVLSIARGTVPFSEATVPSGGPVRFVFEVVAGTADRIGLKPNDRMIHARVAPAK